MIYALHQDQAFIKLVGSGPKKSNYWLFDLNLPFGEPRQNIFWFFFHIRVPHDTGRRKTPLSPTRAIFWKTAENFLFPGFRFFKSNGHMLHADREIGRSIASLFMAIVL
jgi:hypothetical protein